MNKYRESRESARKAEIGRLRLLAAEFAAKGDMYAARHYDRLADDIAQLSLIPISRPKAPRKPERQLPLPLGGGKR